MSVDFQSGVLIGDRSAFVRLSRQGERRADDGMTTAVIEVKGGPFTGTVRDDTLVGVAAFCAELQTLYERLAGSATLNSYEKFKIVVEGDGRGKIQALVEIYGDHVPLSKLTFEMEVDQTYLPKIIRDMRNEFPEG